ncbi:MAG: NAD(P)/FAD-dependent oxidoreductase [Clostridia bacterium]
MSSKIVIVGAGYAGILTAKKLAKKFKKSTDVSITIIDKNPYHVMLTELHEVAACRVPEDSIRASLSKIFAGRNVNVVLDTITSFDFKTQKAIGSADVYEYDYLVISAGSKPTYYGIPGAAENAMNLWSYEDAMKIKDHLEDTFAAACKMADPEQRMKALTFYIVGAGFTGVEMAGELAEYADVITERFDIDRKEVHINIVDLLPRVIPNLSEKMAVKAEKRLAKMGVTITLNSNVCKVGPDYLEIMQDGVCVRHDASTIIWSAGIESADIAAEAAKSLGANKRNRLKTDAFLRSVDNENVFVIGDNMDYTPEGETSPVPQVVENCEQSSAVAAHNIRCLINGTGELKEYKPKFHGFMVCIGGRYGLAYVGFPGHMFNLPSFLAMFVKHFINIVYFLQILGWNKVASYMKHEFFTIRNRRSFVGGHLSNRTPSFLLMPIRVWLGAVWLFEGIKKITEGWFSGAKLANFFGGANAWFDSVLGTASSYGTDAASAATDAVTAATGAAGGGTEAVGTAIMNWNILGIFRMIFVSGKAVAESTMNDFAFKLDVPLINWLVDKLILSSDGMQVFMQIAIVIIEILIGLSLISGLLTFPSSAASLVLQFMFVTTTGLYLGTFWMIFAAIAVLIGGGSTLGLDYYALPFLKDKWKKTKIARKLYIYND